MIPKVCSADHWWSAKPCENQYFVIREALKYFMWSSHKKIWEQLTWLVLIWKILMCDKRTILVNQYKKYRSFFVRFIVLGSDKFKITFSFSFSIMFPIPISSLLFFHPPTYILLQCISGHLTNLTLVWWFGCNLKPIYSDDPTNSTMAKSNQR